MIPSTPLQSTTHVRRPVWLPGVPPRYQLFDRRKEPPMTVGLFYFDPDRASVVFEVYDDVFREFLKREPPFRERRFEWMLDVDPDAPHDTRLSVVRPHPMPVPAERGAPESPPLSLEEAVEGCRRAGYYRVIRTSDPK